MHDLLYIGLVLPAGPQRASRKHSSSRRGETRFPGISRHASELGVSRVHLHLVLAGKRRSSRVLSLYRTLLAKEGRSIPANLGKAA